MDPRREEPIRTFKMQKPGSPPSAGSPRSRTFSSILNRRLEQLGWTAADLARRIEQPYTTVLSWTKGSLDEALARIPSVAKEVGMDTGSLLGDPPLPKIGVDQLLVTRGQYLIDPDYHEIVESGGMLPPGKTWAFEVRLNAHVSSPEEVATMNKALRSKKGRRR